MASPEVGAQLTKLRIDKRRKHRPRHAWKPWIAFVVIAALAGGAYRHFTAAAIAVTVARVERVQATASGGGAAVDYDATVLTASGYVIPRHKIQVSSKIIGRVAEMPVSRGDHVVTGQVLMRLDDRELQAQFRVAQARLAVSQAKLAEMKAGSRPQEIRVARAAVASAQATLENARTDLKRQKALAAERAVAQQELDRAQAAFDVAQANLRSAQENLKLIETWPRPEQLQAQAAQVSQDAANVAFARAQLDDTVILAPSNGTILEKVAEKGELVTNMNFGGDRGAKTSVATMADLKDLQVELDINEADMPKVHMRQSCLIQVDSAPGKTFKGEVDEIAPQADRQKGTVQVKTRLIVPTDDVLPEVNARVRFLGATMDEAAAADSASTASLTTKTPSRTSATQTTQETSKSSALSERAVALPARVFVPRRALAEGPDGQVVYVVVDGRAAARRVKAGDEGPRGVQVLDGLSGGETVVVDPPAGLKDGSRVAVAPGAPSAP
jgi:HlyD family secretion protein